MKSVSIWIECRGARLIKYKISFQIIFDVSCSGSCKTLLLASQIFVENNVIIQSNLTLMKTSLRSSDYVYIRPKICMSV